MSTGSLKNRSSKRSICSCICNYLSLHAFKPPFIISSQADMYFHWMAFWMNFKAFLSCQFDFYRTLKKIGCKCRMMLHGHILFTAKTTADESCSYTDLLFRKLQHPCYLTLVIIY